MKSTQYHPIAKFLHWSVVALIIAQFMNAEAMPRYTHGETGTNIFSDAHFSFGAVIVFFAIVLFAMRFIKPVEKPEEVTPNLQTVLALAMHYALYILLLVVPISGWMFASSMGVAVNILGFYELPAIVAAGSPSVGFLGDAHELLASTLELLAFGHVAAALWHHFILKDNVLNRMRPFVTVK